MKNFTKIHAAALIFSACILSFCSKEEKPEKPIVITSDVSEITGTTAISGGIISDEGSYPITAKGVCWSFDGTPTINNYKSSDGAGSETFVSNLINLTPATTVYVRAYATNKSGTGYGALKPFTTRGDTAYAFIGQATNIDTSSVTLSGTVNSNYIMTTVTFEYDTKDEHSTYVNYNNSFVAYIFSSYKNEYITADLTGLKPGTLYHFRIKASNSIGTTYSDDNTFTTLGASPTITNASFYAISSTSAILNCFVNPNYLETAVTFEYGTTIAYGIYKASDQGGFSGTTKQYLTAHLESLIESTIYHFRVTAKNSLGKTYSEDGFFTTPPIVTDADGNIYQSVIIGDQTWMTENLKTTKYKDGSAIANYEDNSEWAALNTPGYCWYNNDISNKNPYGALYNWYAVNTGSICPSGWHVPTYVEWSTLSSYLGGDSEAGGKLKETGDSHWITPNSGATNQNVFTAVPGGYRNHWDGVFWQMGYSNYLWTSTERFGPDGYFRHILNTSTLFYENVNSKTFGFSVRCIKD